VDRARTADDVERLSEYEEQTHRDDRGIVARRQGGEDNEERVLGQPRGNVAGPDEGRDPFRELAYDLIGHGLAILAVAQLPESIELEAHEADGPLVPLRHPDGLLDVEHGDLTPRETRCGVDEAERAELFARVLEAHLRCRVREDDDRERLSANVEYRLADLDPLAVAYLDQRLGNRHEPSNVALGDRERGPSRDRTGRGVPEDQLIAWSDDRDAVARFAREE